MASINPISRAKRAIAAQSAAELLHDVHPVARVSGNRIWLVTPAGTVNAVDKLVKRWGFDAQAACDGQWHIVVNG